MIRRYGKILFCLFIGILLCFLLLKWITVRPLIENNQENISEETSTMNNNIKMIIHGQEYRVTLENNETAQEFLEMLPVTINMSELNGNEKYFYFDKTFTSNPKKVNYIHAGDIMFYGNNCLVLFYESFNTIYSYTKIGELDNTDLLKETLGKQDILITFTK